MSIHEKDDLESRGLAVNWHRNVVQATAATLRAPGAKVAISTFSFFLVVAVLAPWIAPYGPFERVREFDGELARLLSPRWQHPFGTTMHGNDVFSQVIWGTRRTLTVGFVGALATTVIGINVGLASGFLGGKIDALLMRITDMAYALPFLPLAIVLVGVFGRSDLILLVAIASLFWRTSARVIRSHVLSLKERTFVRAAVAGGASRRRVLFVHIAPNVVSLATLYSIFLIAEAVLAEASLSFLGLSPPNSISWGTIMFDAFNSSQLRTAWWLAFFPGLAIMGFVLSVSLLGRSYERNQHIRMDLEGRRP